MKVGNGTLWKGFSGEFRASVSLWMIQRSTSCLSSSVLACDHSVIIIIQAMGRDLMRFFNINIANNLNLSPPISRFCKFLNSLSICPSFTGLTFKFLTKLTKIGLNGSIHASLMSTSV